MSRHVFVAYAALCYLVFFATFLYLVAFIADAPGLPLAVDQPVRITNIGLAVTIDIGLILLFAVQHSGMARRGFKSWWQRIVPATIERSTYVLFASAALIVLFLGWQPLPATLWQVGNPAARAVLWALFAAGWAIVLLSTFLISHFELFGLQQVWHHWRGRTAAAPVFRQPLFYRLVRHPLYAGFFLAFWATPHMTAGHLLLAGGMSAFMLIAIQMEERDLVHLFGRDYEEYQTRTGMLIPGLGRRG